jgi:hypothetical protein
MAYYEKYNQQFSNKISCTSVILQIKQWMVDQLTTTVHATVIQLYSQANLNRNDPIDLTIEEDYLKKTSLRTTAKKHGLPFYTLFHGSVKKKAIQLISQPTKPFAIKLSWKKSAF